MNFTGILISVVLHITMFAAITQKGAPEAPREQTSIRVIQPKPLREVLSEPKPEPKAEPKPEPKPEPKAEPKPKPKPKSVPKPAPVSESPANSPAAPVNLSGVTLSNTDGTGPAFPATPPGRRDVEPRPKPTPKAKAIPKKVKPKEPACEEAIVKPKATSKVPIDYPKGARELGMEGQVVLRAEVAADGTIVSVKVLRSAGSLIDESAVKALKQWNFSPATKCGKATKSTFTIARRFEIGT
jgi:protein TonB